MIRALSPRMTNELYFAAHTHGIDSCQDQASRLELLEKGKSTTVCGLSMSHASFHLTSPVLHEAPVIENFETMNTAPGDDEKRCNDRANDQRSAPIDLDDLVGGCVQSFKSDDHLVNEFIKLGLVEDIGEYRGGDRGKRSDIPDVQSKPFSTRRDYNSFLGQHNIHSK